MKNVLKHLKKGILMVTMFATLLSFANDAKFFHIKNEGTKTSLTLYNIKQGNLLSVKDTHGEILYKENIQKPGTFTKSFDLTELPNGAYIFELEKDFEISSIPFIVDANTVIFKKENKKTIFKPMVRVEGDFVYITKLTLFEEPLIVDIYFIQSNNSELVYTEKIENTQAIERIYRLDGLKHGSFKLVLHSEGREYIKNIK